MSGSTLFSIGEALIDMIPSRVGGRVLSRNYSGFQDLRRVSQTAAASMGSIPIRPMGAGPNTL